MRVVAAIFLALGLVGTPAQAGPHGSIDLFPFGIDPSTGNRTTPDLGSCEATVTALLGGLVGRLSFGVYARLAGATHAGIAFGELYLQGLETNAPGQLPAGWIKSVALPTSFVGIGLISDPWLQGTELVRRWVVAWNVTGPDDPECRKDPLVLLAIVDLTTFDLSTNFAENHYVNVIPTAPPSDPAYPCLLLKLCDTPAYTGVCITGGQLIINPAGPSCTVSVAPSTWSQVKGLYR